MPCPGARLPGSQAGRGVRRTAVRPLRGSTGSCPRAARLRPLQPVSRVSACRPCCAAHRYAPSCLLQAGLPHRLSSVRQPARWESLDALALARRSRACAHGWLDSAGFQLEHGGSRPGRAWQPAARNRTCLPPWAQGCQAAFSSSTIMLDERSADSCVQRSHMALPCSCPNSLFEHSAGAAWWAGSSAAPHRLLHHPLGCLQHDVKVHAGVAAPPGRLAPLLGREHGAADGVGYARKRARVHHCRLQGWRGHKQECRDR